MSGKADFVRNNRALTAFSVLSAVALALGGCSDIAAQHERDVPQLFYQLRKKISDIKDDLPAGLIGPSINDEYGDVDSILYMITSDGADYAQMKKVAEAFRQRLLKVKDVTNVNLYGTQDEKIYVEFSNAKLATLGITTDQLFQSLARQNAVVPAGVLETT